MTPDRSQQVEDMFHSAIAQEPRERRAFLLEACEGDPSLLAEIESLLAAAENAPDFLEEPLSQALSRAATEVGAGWPEGETGSLAGKRIGAWELIRKVAIGGMGAVYLARRADGHYEKKVAIKLIRHGMYSDDPARRGQMIRRFRDELRHHANLDHPNVAKLLDGGTTADDLPYLVMEYVEGRPIDKYCQEAGLSITERLRLFRTVCLAVQHAHSRFVAHCDIKPTNILVAPATEPGGEAVPKLLDFGIAKLLKQDDNGRPQPSTVTTMRPMTPQYASPEQVQSGPITAASDVYSLGVVLYELVAEQLPYQITEYDAKQTICEQIPKRPSSLRKTVNHEVDTIVLKALEKDPACRYAGPAALAEDIERYLTGRPILAHDDSVLYRLRKFLIRRRSQLASAVLVTALIAASIAVGVWIGQLSRESDRQQAEAQRSQMLSNLDAVGRHSYADAIKFETAGDRVNAESKFLDAQVCFRQVLVMEQDAPPDGNPRPRWLGAETRRLFGHCLLKLHRYPRAEPLLLESYAVIRDHFGEADRRTRETRRWIIELYEAWGKPDKVREWRTANSE